jgi:hypothetical protein
MQTVMTIGRFTQADISLSPRCANSDLKRRSKKALLFDHLVGNGEQPVAHVQHPRSLEANSKVFQKSPP